MNLFTATPKKHRKTVRELLAEGKQPKRYAPRVISSHHDSGIGRPSSIGKHKLSNNS